MKITLARITAAILTAGTLAVTGTSYAAGTASFAVSSASATTGSNTTVYISENGDNVSTATVSFSYDTSRLQLISDSCTGAFPNSIPGGTCYINPGSAPVSGTQSVLAVSFKTIAAGSANVTVTGSQIGSNGTNAWNGTSASATVTISDPVTAGSGTTTTGGQTSTTGNTTTGNSTSNTSSTSTGTTSTPTTSTTPSGSTTTTSPASNQSTKTSRPSAKKVSAPTRHIAFRRAGLVTSGAGVLAIATVALYWFFMRKTPTEVPAAVVKPSAKKTTRSKVTSKK